ncbi:unnamed protein product, partial [Heterotrigona itama]
IFHDVHYHRGILNDIYLMKVFTITLLLQCIIDDNVLHIYHVSRMHLCSSGHSIMS